jgi:Cu-processing system permease protein
MFARIFAIAMNAYRESVRARVLYGLFGLAIATSLYAVIVGTLSLHHESRVIADLGAASISIYAVLVAIVVSATSLHRELELKTLFPILTRPLRRHEYLLGKYLGTLATLGVFVAIDAGAILFLLALEAGQLPWKVGAAVLFLALVLAIALVRAKYTRVFVLIPWAGALVLTAFLLASGAGGDRQLVVVSALLTMCEVSIVAALATLFASFSSPFLTTIFTIGIFLVGRSADTLANIPARSFGGPIRTAGKVLAHVCPNLHLYVPARPLLLGEVAEVPVWPYVGSAAAHALFYATALLTLSALIFRKRDFQ